VWKTQRRIIHQNIVSKRQQDYSPKYSIQTTTALLLPLHCPEKLFLNEFRIQPLTGFFDPGLTFVTIQLHVGTDIIVDHLINKGDAKENDNKVFDLAGPQFLAPATARIWVRLISSSGLNSNDSNGYAFTLWGQWVR